MKNFETLITSLPDRENVVFDIRNNESYVAEISHEPGQPMMIEILPVEGNKNWLFNLNDFIEVLQKGQRYFSK